MSSLSFSNLDPKQKWLCQGSHQLQELGDLLQHSQAIGCYFQENNIKTCAINCTDLSEFVTVFLACVYHDVDIELPSNTTQDILNTLSADVFVGTFANNHNQLLKRDTAVLDTTLDAHNINVSLFTSGSTGKAKKITRQLSQLVSEVNTLEQQWGESLTHDAMFTSTVSQQHIYGLLFTVLWPLLSGRKSWYQMVAFEEIFEQLSNQHKSLVLVTSPAFLKRLDDNLNLPNQKFKVFSSGGLLTDEQQALSERQLNNSISQIYGSSETGGIAFRSLNQKWCFLSGVSHQCKEGTLWVKSAHCFSNDWINTQDQVLIDESDQTFELLGRADRIVKLEEKRVSLTQVEVVINGLNFVSEVKVLVWQNHRQSIAAVIQLNEQGQHLLAESGEKSLKAAIKKQLVGLVDTIALPRYIRFVKDMPMDAQGKTPVSLLKELF